MEYFLGFCPDQEANHKIKKSIVEISKVFDGLDIPVRWIDPNSCFVEILPLGVDISFLRLLLIKYRLKNYYSQSFKVILNTVRLGISRKYKELIYFDVKEGGDSMRDMVLNLRKLLSLKDQGNFIPHIVLGRVNKDLSDQEYTNISKDLYHVGKNLNINDIQFYCTGLKLIRKSQEGFEILLELNQNH